MKLIGRRARAVCICGAALVVSALPPSAARAQTSAAGPALGIAARFTLADAAALARRQHPMLSAAGGRRRAISGTARQEAALPNPVFEWRRENLGSTLQRDEFMSATLPVDLYGRRVALRSAAGQAMRRAVADSSATARDVEFDVARAYWRTALALALRSAAGAQRGAVDTIARIEEERARQGAVPEGSALRARLEADRARLTELSARAEVERARGDLARALALPLDSVPLPSETVAVDTLSAVPGMAGLLAFARGHRPELSAARARVDESTTRRLAERLGTLPGVGVQAGSKRTSGVLTGTVQVGVSLPFFDRNGGNRERAEGDVLMAQGVLRATEAQVEAEVLGAARAYLLLVEDFARATGTTAGGPRDFDARGRTIADIALTAWREGAITLFELLDTERLHADVRAAALRAATDVHLARLDLARALGLAVDAPLPAGASR